MLSSIRQTARSALAATLALFVVVWLNMAIAPCLMAHDVVAGGDPPCPHCPPADDPPCHETAPARCAYIGDYDHDGRLGHGDDHAGTAWLALPATVLFVAPSPRLASAPPPDARATPPPERPLRHRHCVYLI